MIEFMASYLFTQKVLFAVQLNMISNCFVLSQKVPLLTVLVFLLNV